MKINVPLQHKYLDGRIHEDYLALLSRGATPLMCDRYNLEFTNENGIVAWADPELYEVYAGSAMQIGDFWKIYLGRRIDLDEKDEDGSEFMHDLLEEILLFPVTSEDKEWETAEEQPGIWATRPIPCRGKKAFHDDPNYDSDADSLKSWSSNYIRQENVRNEANNGPVKRYEEYDTADDSASDVSEPKDIPEDAILRANVPNAAYSPPSSEHDSGSETESGSEDDGEQKLIVEVRSSNGTVHRSGVVVLHNLECDQSDQSDVEAENDGETSVDNLVSEGTASGVVIIEGAPNVIPQVGQ